MENTQLRKWILQSFKIHGYSVRADASAYLASQMASLDGSMRQKWMEKISNQILKLNLKSLIIDKQDIEECLRECTKKQPSSETIWNVLNIFEVPCFNFSNEKNKFFKDDSFMKCGAFPPPHWKASMLKRRYTSLMQRTLRHDLFKQQVQVATDAIKPKFTLKNAEWFLCSSGRIENAVVLGLLVQKSESHFEIEDLTGSLKLDFSNARFLDGLFPDHCFVLTEGVYEDGVFHVQGLGLPPAEPAIKSRPYFGTVNTFGGPSDTNLNQSVSLQNIQSGAQDAWIVFISDVWLDNIKVLEKLKTLFNGFSNYPPFAFVLLGNFLSSPAGSGHANELKAGLKSLADIIVQCTNVCRKSHFVLVPGPSDPGSPLVLPRPALPEFITEEFRAKVPNATMATNPCRIQYCTREIVVIREDLITKMCRNTIHIPTSGDIKNHFAKTIMSQGSLVCLSVNVCPVYWAYSHGLDLYPLPDLVVTADQFDAFTTSHMDCTVINPGTFMKSGFSFRVYVPATNTIEESVIPDET